MFFSVLIPVYNTSDYLRECVESVLGQNFCDYEIILLDDGSTDESPEMCDEFAAQYPQIRVVHKENEGLMMTRRRGFKEAKGDFFICLDSDDKLLDRNAFEDIHRLIVKENCDMVMYDYMYGASPNKPERHIRLFDNAPNNSVLDDKNYLYHCYLSGRINAMWIKAMSRNIVDIDVDYSVWKSDICRGEDKFQSFPILTAAKRIGYIARPLYYYRWTSGSISNNPKLKYYDAFRTIYKREDEYMQKWKPDDATVLNTKLMRIPNILVIVSGGYEAARINRTMKEWRGFIDKLSADTYFGEIFSKELLSKSLAYYRVLGRLIKKNHVYVLGMVLRSYQLYCSVRHK